MELDGQKGDAVQQSLEWLKHRQLHALGCQVVAVLYWKQQELSSAAERHSYLAISYKSCSRSHVAILACSLHRYNITCKAGSGA